MNAESTSSASPVREDIGRKFWNLNYFIALTGYFFLYTSISLFFLLPLFLRGFSPSQRQIGLIMGVNSLVAIAIRPLFGRITDKQGGKKPALLGLFLLIAVVPFFHLVKDAGALPFLLNALRGLGWGVSMTASVAVCSDLSPADRIARSMGIIGVAGLVANALGPVAGEKIIARWGFGGLFNVSLICLVLSVACLLVTREPIKSEVPVSERRSGVLKSFPFWMLIIVGIMPMFHGSIRAALIYFVPVFAKSVNIGRIGPFFVAFSAAAILSRFWIGDLSDKYGRKKVILPAAVIIGVNCLLISQVHSRTALLVNGFIGGLGQGLIYPALSAYVIDFLGMENKGLAISLYLSLMEVGMGLGSPFYGWLADLGGYRMMYIVGGLMIIAASVVFTWKAPSTDGRLKINKEPGNA